MIFAKVLLGIGLFLSPLAVEAGRVQHPHLKLPPSAKQHRESVRNLFLKTYNAYKKYAWGHDDLMPLSQHYADTRNGWGASIVDALSTMQVIGDLNDYVEEAIEFASNIDFSESKTESTVSVFETTIRFIGGLLSAYELDHRRHPTLLRKAQQVADKLAYAWSSGTPIPFGHLNFTSNEPEHASSNIAEAGTLALEWFTLAKYTKNQTYADLGVGALRHIATLQKPLPGLASQGIDPFFGRFTYTYVTWGGGSDSYFEYLIKYARLTNTQDQIFVNQWITAVDTSIKYLARKSTVGNHTYLADYDWSSNIRVVGSHLACFHGGNWILGGRLLDNKTIVDFGLELADGCWNTYNGTTTGIGPEQFGYKAQDSEYNGGTPVGPAEDAFYDHKGFYFLHTGYILRPEVLESNFHAWRATGDIKYYNRAVSALESFTKYLSTDEAVTGLWDVGDAASGRYDHMESFWFAEVLKYLYLTFDDPRRFSLDDYVFNTEAHPFKAPPAKRTYGPGKIEFSDGFSPDSFITPSFSGPIPAISPSYMYPNGLNEIFNIK